MTTTNKPSKTQFVLVEREGYHPTAVSRNVFADMHAAGIVVSWRPITKAEIKRARIHVYEDEHYFQEKAYQEFCARVQGKTFKATVLWFRRDGTGYVSVEGEGNWPLYACNIAGKRTWFAETACVYVERGDVLDIVFHPSRAGTLVESLTSGKFDAEKWASLDQEKLAFKCDEDGKATNGLFGT